MLCNLNLFLDLLWPVCISVTLSYARVRLSYRRCCPSVQAWTTWRQTVLGSRGFHYSAAQGLDVFETTFIPQLTEEHPWQGLQTAQRNTPGKGFKQLTEEHPWQGLQTAHRGTPLARASNSSEEHPWQGLQTAHRVTEEHPWQGLKTAHRGTPLARAPNRSQSDRGTPLARASNETKVGKISKNCRFFTNKSLYLGNDRRQAESNNVRPTGFERQ